MKWTSEIWFLVVNRVLALPGFELMFRLVPSKESGKRGFGLIWKRCNFRALGLIFGKALTGLIQFSFGGLPVEFQAMRQLTFHIRGRACRLEKGPDICISVRPPTFES